MVVLNQISLVSRISDSNQTSGYLIEYLNFNSDGFKSIDIYLRRRIQVLILMSFF